MLADFGCSSILKNKNQKLSGWRGTTTYMAPEINYNFINKQYKPFLPFPADIYSLGIVIVSIMGLDLSKKFRNDMSTPSSR